jgi:hypothetical protein
MLQEKTLAFLARHSITEKQIFIFVSSESYDLYVEQLSHLAVNVVLGKDTITTTRNFIVDYFPQAQKVLEMDDDIEDIVYMKKQEKNRPVDDFRKLICESFGMLKGSGVFGFNAMTSNIFATSDKFGLYSLIGSCVGYFNEKSVHLELPEKEDFERVVKFYQLGLPVLKRTNFGTKTKYWVNAGGIQSRYPPAARIKKNGECGKRLMEMYPGLFYKRKRANGIIDVRFRKPYI